MLLSEPGILGGVERLEVLDPNAADALVVEIDKIVTFAGPGAEERLAQIDAVEDDRIAVIVLPIVRRRLKTGELGEGGPLIHMGPHVHINRSGLNVAGPPGNRRHAEAAFEQRSLHAAERCVTRIRPSVDPGAVVGGPHHERILVNAEIADRLTTWPELSSSSISASR